MKNISLKITGIFYASVVLLLFAFWGEPDLTDALICNLAPPYCQLHD